MEGNFCASAEVENPNDEEVGKIDKHEVNTGFTGGDFSTGGWDEL